MLALTSLEMGSLSLGLMRRDAHATARHMLLIGVMPGLPLGATPMLVCVMLAYRATATRPMRQRRFAMHRRSPSRLWGLVTLAPRWH